MKPKRPRLEVETLPIESASGLRTRGQEAPTSGRLLGDYLLGEALGQGGMGTVYRAHDPDLGRDLAIKVVRVEADGGQSQERLVREAKAMASVDHPHVITVYRTGIDAGQVYIAMELVDGGTIRTWIESHAPPISEVLECFRKAGEGLHAAHKAGLVHRDFKPDNVLVGDDGRVRVTDFGLVSVVQEPRLTESGARAQSTHLTQTGTVMGTAAYMSPEQHRGEKVDARADQFSFGVSLYEALVGERPFQGKNFEDMKRSILRGDFRRPPATIPSFITKVIERALKGDPAERFANMGALLEALGAEHDESDVSRQKLAECRALYERGRVAQGLALARRIGAEMEAAGDDALLAEFKHIEGLLRAGDGDPDADESLANALDLALSAKVPHLVARIATDRVLSAVLFEDEERVDTLLPAALEWRDGIEDRSAIDEARFALTMAFVNAMRGLSAEAQEHGEYVLKLWYADRKNTALAVAGATAHSAMAQAYGRSGDASQQVHHFLEAIRTFEAHGFQAHVVLGAAYNNLGVAYTENGHHEMALHHQERAFEIFQRTLGPRHPMVSVAQCNVADSLSSVRRHEEAISWADAGLTLARETQTAPASMAAQLYCVARVRHRSGGDAVTPLRECLALRIAALPPRSPQIPQTHAFLGVVLEAKGDNAGAYENYLAASGLLVEAQRLEDAGRAEFSMVPLCADPVDALVHAENALRYFQHPHILHRLAEVLASEGPQQDWERVRALAEQLDSMLGDDEKERRADVTRWLSRKEAS